MIANDGRLTRAELETRANRLARRLIARGVTPESRVGLALPRSLDMIVGLLAILKAGGAYVPLDPSYPSARLRHMIEDSRIALLLTQTDVAVNHVNNLGWTALLEAIILSDGGVKHQQIVQLLIEHGADVNLPDKDGVRPLQHARTRGFRAIEQLLLKANAR